MRMVLYKELMDKLDALLYDGLEEEAVTYPPWRVLDELLDLPEHFREVSEEELHRCILQWQERNMDEGYL